MASRVAGYLTRTHEQPRHALTRRRDRETDEWSSAGKGLAVLGIAAAALIVTAGVYYMPDFIRYLKIRRM